MKGKECFSGVRGRPQHFLAVHLTGGHCSTRRWHMFTLRAFLSVPFRSHRSPIWLNLPSVDAAGTPSFAILPDRRTRPAASWPEIRGALHSSPWRPGAARGWSRRRSFVVLIASAVEKPTGASRVSLRSRILNSLRPVCFPAQPPNNSQRCASLIHEPWGWQLRCTGASEEGN